MYIQAENDKFYRKIKGIGSSADCWSSVLQKKITTVTCSGHHYSMMDSKRGPDVGKVVSVAAQIKFRSLFSKRYRIVENGCHKQAIADCKRNGLKAVFIKKTGKFEHITCYSCLSDCFDAKVNERKMNAEYEYLVVKLLKISIPILTPTLCEIFNLSLSTGTFSDSWKITRVVPIFKKGSTCENQITARIIFIHLKNPFGKIIP